MILVLKMTKKYHITWFWCQNIRDNMVEKRVNRFRQGSPPPLFGNARKKTFFSQEGFPYSLEPKMTNMRWCESHPPCVPRLFCCQVVFPANTIQISRSSKDDSKTSVGTSVFSPSPLPIFVVLLLPRLARHPRAPAFFSIHDHLIWKKKKPVLRSGIHHCPGARRFCMGFIEVSFTWQCMASNTVGLKGWKHWLERVKLGTWVGKGVLG